MSIFGEQKPALYPTTGAINTTSIIGSGTTTTIETASVHGLAVGDGVLLQGITGATSSINGSYKVQRLFGTDSFGITHTAAGSPTGGNITKGIYLTHSTISFNFVEAEQLNYRSVISGVKTNTHLGDYGTFKVIVHLWKFSSAKTMLTNLYAYYHTDVIFCPNQLPIKDSSSNLVYCYLNGFRPFYWRNFRDYDAVELTFDINKYHDVSKLLI